ncbi:MAG: hypothetical protein CL779_00660 [Chloroflexi bacterium]|nr:hypothetical protein [Chloroflexota bacterium]|tara:strand:- start:383 stop:1147 length:765 start_codon:yes stop_codon:yes gene_type:complete
MATLTYDPSEPQDSELNEAEQESLAIGEKALEEQNKMLAGKFEDAEALEKAYIELQKKLGSTEETTEETTEEVETETTEESEVNPTAQLIQDASVEWNEKGELSDEMMSKFAEMDSKDLVSAYMEMQQSQQSADLTDKEVLDIKGSVGGEESYGQIVEWAGQNMDESAVNAFDTLINSGDAEMIKLAVAGMKAQYEAANGYEGRMLTGKAAQDTKDVFRSQAEVVRAMQDPRYDTDPAYRSDVFKKLEQSNINY